MANANPQTRNPLSPTLFKLLKLIVIVFLALVILVGLTILIIWLTIKPKRLVYSIDDGTINHYHLSHALYLNTTFNFILRAYNPNKKVSIYYDKVDIRVSYYHQTISRGTIDPFYQPKRNTTRNKLNLASHDVILQSPIAYHFRAGRSSGQVKLGVKLNARIHFNVGVWKSRHYSMKVSCAPIEVHFFSSPLKGFQRTMCDVDF